MKLAILHFYQGYVDRGVETYIDELATRLSRSIDVKLFQAGTKINKLINTKVVSVKYNPKHSDSRLRPQDLRKRLFLDHFKLRELLFTLKTLASLNRFDPEYVMPTDSGWQVLIIKLYCLLKRKKLILVGHSGSGWDDRFNLLVRPDIFIALGTAQADWAKKVSLWKDQKIVIIPNGVDLNKFSPSGTKFNSGLKKPILIHVGAPSDLKNTLNTIRAVAKTKASLLVVGDGDQNNEADGLGLELLGERYRRVVVPYSKMPEAYRSADAFILVSGKHEAFGIAYLEAMATNVPVIATDDQKRREIVGGAGAFVKDIEDPASISEKIGEVLSGSFGKTPIEQAKKFSWDVITQDYLNLF